MIGIDFYKTITKYPKYFRNLAAMYIQSGYPVYIISAVHPKNVAKLREEVKRSKVPYTHLEVVPFIDVEDIPQLKLYACQRLGVKFMYDDMDSVCQLLLKEGIGTFQVK